MALLFLAIRVMPNFATIYMFAPAPFAPLVAAAERAAFLLQEFFVENQNFLGGFPVNNLVDTFAELAVRIVRMVDVVLTAAIIP